MHQQLAILILLVVVVIVVLLFITHNTTTEANNECQSDVDCQIGVCHVGKCVECAFDSDCCGGDVCMHGHCVIDTTPEPFMLEGFCIRTSNFYDDGENDFGLEGTINPEGPDLDYSTFEIISAEGYATVNGMGNVECDNEVFGVSDSPLILTPVITQPDTVTFTGTGALAGTTATFVASHDGAGTFTTTWTSTPEITSTEIALQGRVQCRVANTEGVYSEPFYITHINGYNFF